ncbi:MAG: Holliday junction resolvase RuvX [Raineya sp.]|nr:Holliday junction resolvase RuvX [Raineya sp.]MDW8295629.1 Holliday junction resolvase RuvX [Raineya sp.]
MSRILAIDYGTKRVGLAVTDNEQIIATALATIATEEIFTFLEKYLQKEQVEAFVIGKPTPNSQNERTLTIENFVQKVRQKFPQMPIYFVNESFTSKIALQTMISAGSKKKDRRKETGNLDKISAVIILQDFLEQRKLSRD